MGGSSCSLPFGCEDDLGSGIHEEHEGMVTVNKTLALGAIAFGVLLVI